MNDIPSNDKLVNTENEEQIEFEESTIFSAPSAHKKTADGKKKKRFLTVIIAVLSVAIIFGGTLAIYKFIPEKEDKPITPAFQEISVLSLNTDDLNTVTVENENGKFEFYSEKTTVNDEESEASSTTVNWFLKDYNSELLDSYKIKNILSSAASIKAIREITEKSEAECGLDSPQIKIDMVDSSENKTSIMLGKQSPDNNGMYLKVSGSDKIYLVGSDFKSSFVFKALDLANAEPLESFSLTDDMTDYKAEDGTLAKFDSIKISGKNFQDEVELVFNDDSAISQYIVYKVKSPVERMADNVDILFNAFKSGITTDGAYSFDVTPSSLSAVGLDNPDLQVTMQILNKTLTYKFKLQEDGYYAAVSDNSKLIAKVSGANISFVNYSATDFYSKTVCLFAINDLSGFTFKAGDTSYDFDITVDEAEDAEEKYIIKYNDKKLVAQNFQDYYQQCLMLNCTDFTIDKTDLEPEYSMIFKFNKENLISRVDFIKVSATRYQYRIDGIDIGKVNSAAVKKLAKYTETVANGGKIN